MTIQHYSLPTASIPAVAPQTQSHIGPKYYNTDLAGQSYVAFYYNGNASVLIATEQNSALEGESDVSIIPDNATLQSVVGVSSVQMNLGGQDVSL
jgi:hypothetical protein